MTSTAWTNSPVGHLGDGEGMKADTMRKKGVIPTTTTSSPFSDATTVSTVFGVVILSVAAAAVIWRVKLEQIGKGKGNGRNRQRWTEHTFKQNMLRIPDDYYKTHSYSAVPSHSVISFRFISNLVSGSCNVCFIIRTYITMFALRSELTSNV